MESPIAYSWTKEMLKQERVIELWSELHMAALQWPDPSCAKAAAGGDLMIHSP